MTAFLLENFKLVMLLLLIGSVIILSHLREPQLGKSFGWWERARRAIGP
jgi:hypothetical protein